MHIRVMSEKGGGSVSSFESVPHGSTHGLDHGCNLQENLEQNVTKYCSNPLLYHSIPVVRIPTVVVDHYISAGVLP